MAVRNIYDDPNSTLIQVMYMSIHYRTLCVPQELLQPSDVKHVATRTVMFRGCETFLLYPAEST
jgi:hypothetical protein